MGRFEVRKISSVASLINSSGTINILPYSSRLPSRGENMWTFYNPVPAVGVIDYFWGGTVIASNGSNTYATTADAGLTWTTRTLPTGTKMSGKGGIFLPNYFCAIDTATNTGRFYYTADYVNYTTLLTLNVGTYPAAMWQWNNAGTLTYNMVTNTGAVYQTTSPTAVWSTTPLVSTSAITAFGTPNGYSMMGRNSVQMSYALNGSATYTAITSPFLTTSSSISNINVLNYTGTTTMVTTTAGEWAYSGVLPPTTWTLGTPFVSAAEGLNGIYLYSTSVPQFAWFALSGNGRVFHLASSGPSTITPIDITPKQSSPFRKTLATLMFGSHMLSVTMATNHPTKSTMTVALDSGGFAVLKSQNITY